MKRRPLFRESDGPSYRGRRLLWIRRKDICARTGDVYLTRWTLAELFGWALMVHVMRRPDQDRCHHDHPWPFVTLVLRGGYFEQVTDLTTGTVREQFNAPGALLYRPAIHTHRVADLPQGSCTTLVLRGPRRRKWGFRNPDGRWRAWDAFVDWAGTVLWCDERDTDGGAT